ncbi:MAG: flavin prenyltransferase UbiX [Gammaproteobacteria bacterium]|nr:MAG: flavin prenyltransferase UbiX [Gammaproteobacteria bacterium]
MADITTSTIALAMTGASGAAYGLRLLECLLKADKQVYLMLSTPGQIVISMETDLKMPSRPTEIQTFLTQHYGAAVDQLQVFGKEQWTAPIASGSGVPDAMVVCPCTMGTLAGIATGISRNLIERAADVVLKERRQLILVPRETPFSEIHLQNMLTLTRMGAVMLPPNPGFYRSPNGIDDLVDFVVARILDQLGIPQTLMARWGMEHAD